MSAFKRLIFCDPYDITFAVLKDDFKPYSISNRPVTGPKDFMGNRDCLHRQFHGQAIINDFGYQASKYQNGTWSKYWGWDYEIAIPLTNGQTWYIGKTVYQGLIIDEWHNLYYPSYDYFTAPYHRYASFEGNYGIYIDLSTHAFRTWVSGVDRRHGFEITVNYQLVYYDSGKDKWLFLDSDSLSFSSILLPDGCRWWYSSISGTGGTTTDVHSSLRIIADDATISENEEFFLTLVYDVAAKLRKHLSNCPINYNSGSDVGYKRIRMFDSKPKYLKRSDFPKIRDELNQISLVNEPQTDKSVLVGNATQSAADAARDFEGNTGTLINELLHLKESLVDLYKMLRGEVNLKSLSSLYLTGKYGLRLTAKDTMELAQRVVQELNSPNGSYSVARGSATENSITCRCKLYYDQNTADDFSKAMFQLQSWDLFPSFQNVWDIIPYSFVIDWFVDIEGFLSAIDTRTLMSTMNIFRVLYSIKKEWRCTESVLTSYGIVGSISFSHYERWSEPEPWPVIPTFSGNDPSSHIVEGSALILQRL